MKKIIILFSGGLDSSTLCAMNYKKYDITAVTFNYGQRHNVEIKAAKNIIKILNIKNHITIDIDNHIFLGSSLTDKNIDIIEYKKENTNIPNSYVPARNTIFLSYALAIAESHNIFDIYIGANMIDYSGYPDCREEYLNAFEIMANLATKNVNNHKYKIHAPFLKLKKSDIIKIGNQHNFNYGYTSSCYNPLEIDGKILSCGKCDSCFYRKKGFEEAGITDPTIYY